MAKSKLKYVQHSSESTHNKMTVRAMVHEEVDGSNSVQAVSFLAFDDPLEGCYRSIMEGMKRLRRIRVGVTFLGDYIEVEKLSDKINVWHINQQSERDQLLCSVVYED